MIPRYADYGLLPCQGRLPPGVVAPFLWLCPPPFPLTKHLGAPYGMAPRTGNVSVLPYSIFNVLRGQKSNASQLGTHYPVIQQAGNLSLTYRQK